MDTAQRGMGLDWAATRELIERSSAEADRVGGRIACGAGTDQLTALPSGTRSERLGAVVSAYAEQVKVVEGAGSRVIMMASRALAVTARTAEDYLQVYEEVLDVASEPVILHWLGDMFDPALTGYWGSTEVGRATETFLAARRGERRPHRRGQGLAPRRGPRAGAAAALPAGVRLYTGDDFNYPGAHLRRRGRTALRRAPRDLRRHRTRRVAALQALDRGDEETARAVLDSTRELGRHVFEAPTRFYKTGIAFLAWLNGRQPGFQMIDGLATGRSVLHLSRVVELADAAGLLADPDLAAHRMRQWLAVNGWEAP